MFSKYLPFPLLTLKLVLCLPTTSLDDWQTEPDLLMEETDVVVEETSDDGNSRPIIGVVAQKTFGKNARHGPSYFPASYVKFLEMGGARVVPVKINQTEEYYQYLFERINGVLLPGGGQDLLHSGYANAARYFFKKAKTPGNYFPIWGTCLGFEELLVLAAEENILDNCIGTSNVALPVDFYQNISNTKLFKHAPSDVIQALERENITANYHKKCLWLKTFFAQGRIFQYFFNILTTNVDDNANRFISAVEAKWYPIYGVQWHPEKNPFEWNPKLVGVTHTDSAIKVAQYFANFFISEAKKNDHKFESAEEEQKYLIYNYNATYVGSLDHSSFEQAYFFNV